MKTEPRNSQRSPKQAIALERRILMVRGQKVIIDLDLSELYGVQTKVLNQALSRNQQRFPEDFAFGLSREEKAEVVTNCDHLKNRRMRPAAGAPVPPQEQAPITLISRHLGRAAVLARAFVRIASRGHTHKSIHLRGFLPPGVSSLEQLKPAAVAAKRKERT